MIFDHSQFINIKQILTLMMMTMREDFLLGSYRQKDYSKGFQKLMSNVVAKIYRNKGSKQNVFRTLAAPFANREPQSNHRSTKISFNQEVNRRKNSQPISSFSLNFPKTNGFSMQNEHNKYSLPSFKLPEEYNKTPTKPNKKCHSLPHNQYQLNIYQKINEYNTCLITKTYRLQEKEKLAVCVDETDRSQESPSFISKIRKCQNFKKNNRWIHSKGKFLKENTQIVEQKEDFKPWQIQQSEQIQY